MFTVDITDYKSFFNFTKISGTTEKEKKSGTVDKYIDYIVVVTI